MDMPIHGGFSRYYNPQIKRKGIFEPKEVEVGCDFIARLVSLRLRQEEDRPTTKEERQARFERDKNRIAEAMGYDSYRSLPQGAKSFESRCSAIQRKLPRMSYSDIAKEEQRYNMLLSEQLYRSIMEELDSYVSQLMERERRRHLVRRMSCYLVPYIVKT